MCELVHGEFACKLVKKTVSITRSRGSNASLEYEISHQKDTIDSLKSTCVQIAGFTPDVDPLKSMSAKFGAEYALGATRVRKLQGSSVTDAPSVLLAGGSHPKPACRVS